MFCRYCGAIIRDDAIYCKYCGRDLRVVGQPQQDPPQQAASTAERSPQPHTPPPSQQATGTRPSGTANAAPFARTRSKKMRPRSSKHSHPFVGIVLAALLLLGVFNGISSCRSTGTFSLGSLVNFSGAENIPYSGEAPWGYYRNQLTADQKAAYDQMFKAIATDRKEVKIAGLEESSAKRAFRALTQDHPEFFWINSSCSFTKQSSGLLNKISFSWKTDTAKRDADKQAIESQANAFIQSLGTGSSTYDRVKATYRYVIQQTEYDQSQAGTDSHDLRGVFLDGSAVCEGYTDALLYLLHKEGIEAAFVEGTATGGRTSGKHAWNLVNIDGTNTLVDSTWGDSEYGEEGDGVEYYYLCLTSEELGRDHTPDKDFTLPTCTSHAYDYFQLNNCYFSSYDQSTMAGFLLSQIKSGRSHATVKFANQSSYVAAKSAIENRSLLGDVTNRLGRAGSFLHSEQDTRYTVYFGWSIS